MTTDALDVRRDALVRQAEDVVVQLADARAWPWLVQAGAEPEELLGQLREAAAATRRALLLANAAQKEVRAAQQSVAPVLERVRDWQVQARAQLRRAPAGELARRAAAEVRTLLRTGANRLAGALVMLHTAAGRLRDHAGVLGEGVVALAADGDALRGVLLALQRGLDQAVAAQVQAGQVAREEVATLRQLMREVRASWRIARWRSADALPPLNLALAKGEVMIRPRARQKKRDDAPAGGAPPGDGEGGAAGAGGSKGAAPGC